MKKVAILQSNYIPWKGYFDIIYMVDEFIIYDDAQYTRRDWRNRNKIKTINGLQWLTIPVDVKGKYHQKIKDTKISDGGWRKKHWMSIVHHYSQADNFKENKEFIEGLYLGHDNNYLSEVNRKFIIAINQYFGIDTKVSLSMDYDLKVEGSTEKLAHLCRQAGADIYLSGPAAKDYLEENKFREVGIEVNWMDYSGYSEYSQIHPPFIHGVSIIDLICNQGANSLKFMKSFKGNH